MDIRDAMETDAPGILRIYNDAVEHTTAIWNDQPSSLEARIAWLKERQQSGYPVIVAADGPDILGYGSFGAFRPWDGYRHTVEHSVYVDGAARRMGIGHALMDRLVARPRHEQARHGGGHRGDQRAIAAAACAPWLHPSRPSPFGRPEIRSMARSDFHATNAGGVKPPRASALRLSRCR
jgi:L-amino acid N-acyltransferase YncA